MDGEFAGDGVVCDASDEDCFAGEGVAVFAEDELGGEDDAAGPGRRHGCCLMYVFFFFCERVMKIKRKMLEEEKLSAFLNRVIKYSVVWIYKTRTRRYLYSSTYTQTHTQSHENHNPMQQASPIIPNKASPPVINMHSYPHLHANNTGFKLLYPIFLIRGVRFCLSF